MTTIATDGKTMAGDGRALDHRDVLVCETRRKIVRLPDGSLFGGSGSRCSIDKWVTWFRTEEGDKPEVKSFIGLLLRPDGTVWRADDGGSVTEIMLPAAIGSGGEIALGVLLHGGSPREAVTLACSRDPFSGGTITVEAL